MPTAAKTHRSFFPKRKASGPRVRVFDYTSSNRRWRKLRASVLASEPLCRACRTMNRTTPATQVDHITPISAGGEAYDRANLQSLCASCHSKKTTRQDGGGFQRGVAQ
jgi:5-methylcytosine-specific restriction protein A